MTLYITLFFGLCALSLFEAFPIWKINRLSLTIFLGGTFWILSFSRWENGTDWNVYHSLYETFANTPSFVYIFSGAMEPGYILLNYVFSFLHSYHLFLAVLGLLVFIPKLLPILRESPYISVSFLVYFCTMLADIFFVRQSIAISLCFLALWLSYKGHKRWPYCLILAAITIHISAVVFVPLLLFPPRTKRSLSRDIITAMLVLSVSVAAWAALSAYLSSLDMSVSFLLLTDKINGFIVNNGTGGAADSKLQDGLRIFKDIAIYVYFCVRAKHINQRFALLYSRLLQAQFYGTLLVCAFSLTAYTLIRFSTYFTVCEILLFPIALSSHKGFGKALFASALLAYCIVSLYQGLFSSYHDMFVPFNFYAIPIP
ncbi:MAG: EpsG family protein [Sulfobacillus sp.]